MSHLSHCPRAKNRPCQSRVCSLAAVGARKRFIAWHLACRDAVGKRDETLWCITPDSDSTRRHNGPDAAIVRGVPLVGGGWFCKAIGVRMEVAGNPWPALPCSAVRIDQYLRIDLEVAFGLRMDIGGRKKCGDTPCLTQQDPAAFARVGVGGMAKDTGNNRA